MYELTLAALFLMGAHVAVIYYGTDVLHLTFQQLLIFTVIVAIATTVLVEYFSPMWRTRIANIVNHEEDNGTYGVDIMGVFIVTVLAGFITNKLIIRRFGWTGWVGLFGVNMILNAVI
jgi:hypothetical protein